MGVLSSPWQVLTRAGMCCGRDGKMLELGAFASADMACQFPGADTLGVLTYLKRLDLSGNPRIIGK